MTQKSVGVVWTWRQNQVVAPHKPVLSLHNSRKMGMSWSVFLLPSSHASPSLPHQPQIIIKSLCNRCSHYSRYKALSFQSVASSWASGNLFIDWELAMNTSWYNHHFDHYDLVRLCCGNDFRAFFRLLRINSQPKHSWIILLSRFKFNKSCLMGANRK